ncbi:NADH-ubiquinone oxidoreductase B18 subunit (CI-B18) [Anopheles sinensis]|uniref:NADH-ubiquinone oxidoreductase B18 subunit (CI-B18) n=1 Tax=Anopheles sinensis TaxID=74873 RepID=A0A084VX48_ANOSI|nr:NADH-ubiquinone oxidoreductase B18 subunit (CI-B18) [Anopheles sinensis]
MAATWKTPVGIGWYRNNNSPVTELTNPKTDMDTDRHVWEVVEFRLDRFRRRKEDR